MHAELPYREVPAPPYHASEAHTEPRPHHEDDAHPEPHKKRLHHHVIDNLKHHLAAVIAVLIIAVVVPLCIRWYRTHIAGTTTTTSASISTTTTTAPSAPSVAKIVQDPAAATADMVTSNLGSDDSSDDSGDNSNSGKASTGMVFAGKGRYQLYRQGKITWRLNTDSGEACILFATEEEWHKQRVYENGCNSQ